MACAPGPRPLSSYRPWPQRRAEAADRATTWCPRRTNRPPLRRSRRLLNRNPPNLSPRPTPRRSRQPRVRAATVDTLADVQIGFEGARRITSLALGPEGVPDVAYSDVGGIWLARAGADGTWATEEVSAAGSRPLGQLVSLEVDATGTPHIAFFEVTANSPLAGLVGYLTPTA